MNEKKCICLNSEKELRIFMLPLRQRIIKEMQIIGKPVTAKNIADRLGITPSSAKHHLGKLELIGLVEPSHTKLINGITAKYIKLSNVTIKIGQELNDTFSDERNLLVKNIISEIYSGYEKAINSIHSVESSKKNKKYGDVLSGIIHLSDEDLEEIYTIVNNYINTHEKSKDDTHPWEYALIAYRTDYLKED